MYISSTVGAETFLKLYSSILYIDYCMTGASILGGLGGSRPPDFGQGRSWGRRGSWTGREVLLYLSLYRKYVRKW